MTRVSLGQLSFFNGICQTHLGLLEPYFSSHTYPLNAVVFEQGEKADYLYLVVRGEITIQYKPDDGPVMTVARVQPGGVFGWSAAIGNAAYTSAALCSADCEVLRIRDLDLRNLFGKYPEVGHIILDRLTTVIAERKQCQQQVMLMLRNGISQPTERGELDDGRQST